MPRRHKNVRHRNVPRAAQRKPAKYTPGTQSDARPASDSSGVPRDIEEALLEIYSGDKLYKHTGHHKESHS